MKTTGGDSKTGRCVPKREPVQHSADRAQADACADKGPLPVPVSWTFNPKMTDAELRDYYDGLIIVSQPGALYGPDE